MTILTIAAALMLATTSMAQDNGKKPPRTMNYYPDQGQIVCVNGNNRYTRALYGANTRQRLETSDRPVFASYDRDNSLNICFLMESNGQLQPLDSTTFCEALKGTARSAVPCRIHIGTFERPSTFFTVAPPQAAMPAAIRSG